ncbi:MAG: DUF1624 domain-containing protein [Salaquimonas sp.]|nr:DUF1624 domain-containing protein [Salaquimonas sp.]
MTRSNDSAYGGGRIALVDLARGVALIAMTAFHFTWDLEMFGIAPRDFMASTGMIVSARLIAGSFLFLVGFSLFLAHGRAVAEGGSIRWRPFFKRLAQILAAAALITIATWYATPQAFIFFGILHAIALGSMLALAFLYLPWWLTAVAGLAVLTLRDTLRTEVLDAPIWWWSGLSRITPLSNDYVPVFPFFGLILLGVAAGGFAWRHGLLASLARPRLDNAPARLLRFIGRHSLIYYLAHQPVMLAILYSVLWVTGYI